MGGDINLVGCHNQLLYALKDGNIISINDVGAGLSCGCVCPACGEELIAKKGSQRIHHFAHRSNKECEYGYETSLHYEAKMILAKAKTMMIPKVVHYYRDWDMIEVLSEAKEIAIDRVELEKREGDMIPDVVIYSRDRKLYVEIFVTHPVDHAKLEKLKAGKVSTIEIDLSERRSLISEEELTELLLGECREKRWIYNHYAETWYQRLCSIAEKKTMVSHGNIDYVDDCPIKARICKGHPYADFYQDCQYCKYIVDWEDDYFLCSGKTGIGTIRELIILTHKEKERKQKE